MPYAPCQHTLNTLSQLCLASAIIEPAGRVRQMVSANAMHIVRRAAGNYILNEAEEKRHNGGGLSLSLTTSAYAFGCNICKTSASVFTC